MIIRIAITVWISIGALSTVAIIGKDRDPVTPGVAVVSIILACLFIWGIWSI